MLAVIAAMQKEADVFLSLYKPERHAVRCGKNVYECRCGDKEMLLILSGVGKANAAAATMLALASDADKLLNFGVAGGLTPCAPIGKVLQIERAVEFDIDLSQVNGTPVGTPDECSGPYFLVRSGRNEFEKGTLATADHFGSGTADNALLGALQADVRDMEGAAVTHVAYAAGIPCFIFKAISDNAGEESVREYRENLQIALGALREAFPAILREVYNG